MQRMKARSSTVLESLSQCRGQDVSSVAVVHYGFWNREKLFAVHSCIWDVTKYKANTENKERIFLVAFHQIGACRKNRVRFALRNLPIFSDGAKVSGELRYGGRVGPLTSSGVL